MPELSRFFGIVITVFYNDHAPPHIHIRYGKGHEGSLSGSVEITSGKLIAGEFPRAELLLVQKWLSLHLPEVRKAWQDSRAGKEPIKIEPLPATKAKKKKAERDSSRVEMVRGVRFYPSLQIVEWLETNLVRLFFSTGLIKEIRLPVRSARKAVIVFDGLGLDIDGKGYEMSAPRLASMRGKTVQKALSRGTRDQSS